LQFPTGGASSVPATGAGKAKSFYGSVDVNPATAKMRLVQLAEEIISNLASDPQAELKITVEITADFPNGATDQIKRAVSENETKSETPYARFQPRRDSASWGSVSSAALLHVS
jgi:hypothetical protein